MEHDAAIAKTKTVFISAYIPGSMHVLRDYFYANVQKARPDIKLIFHDHYKTDSIKHKLTRVQERLSRYDVSVGDYPSRVSCRGKHNIFIPHGYGTKCSPGKEEYDRPEVMDVIAAMRQNTQTLVTMSEWDATYYWRAPAFEHMSYPEVKPLGLPRNDVLFDKANLQKSRDELDAAFGTKDKFVVLYAPTWRGYDVKYPFTEQDFKALDAGLGKLNATLLYRPHYLENLYAGVDFYKLAFDNILTSDFTKQADTASLLCASDMLVTDFSSIYVDFVATQRPIAYIALDIDRYDAHRGLVVDFKNDTHTPGPKLDSFSGLLDFIRDTQTGQDSYKQARANALSHFFHYADGHSAQRVWDMIIERISI